MLKKMTRALLISAALLGTLNSFADRTASAQELTFTVDAFPVEAKLVEGTLSPDGGILAVYENVIVNNSEPLDQYLWLVDPATGDILTTFSEPTDYVKAVAFTSDSLLMASIHDNASIYIWDMSTQTLLQTFELPLMGIGSVMSFMPDNQTLVFINNDLLGQIFFLDIDTGYITRLLGPHAATRRALSDRLSEPLGRAGYAYRFIALAPDGNTIAVTTGTDAVFVWNLETGEKTTVRPGVTEGVSRNDIVTLAYTVDGRRLAYANPREGSVTLLNADTGEPETVLEIIADAFVLTPDGSSIAWTSRESGAVYIAPLNAVDQPKTLLELPEDLNVFIHITDLQFTADGRTLLVTGLFNEDYSSVIYKITLGE